MRIFRSNYLLAPMSDPRYTIEIELQNRKPGPHPKVGTIGNISHSQPIDEEDSILRPYAFLGRPSENSSKDTGLDFNRRFPTYADIMTASLEGDGCSRSHVLSGTLLDFSDQPDRPYSPVASAADSITDDLETPNFDMPLALSQFDCSNQESFDTSTLMDSTPDCLTGHEIALPVMETESLLDTSILAAKNSETTGRRIRSLHRPPTYTKLPRLRTGTPAYEITSREGPDAIAAASDSSLFGRWTIQSDFSYDGMSAATKAKDTTVDRGSQDTADEISPTTKVQSKGMAELPLAERRSLDSSSDCQGLIAIPDASITSEPADTRSDLYDNSADNPEPRIQTPPDEAIEVANLDGDRPIEPALPLYTTIPGVPKDITGELPAPRIGVPTPAKAKPGKRRRMIQGIQKFYRGMRTVLLRRRLLVVILGKQLAKPTREQLLAISNGAPVNIGDAPAAKPSNPPPISA